MMDSIETPPKESMQKHFLVLFSFSPDVLNNSLLRQKTIHPRHGFGDVIIINQHRSPDEQRVFPHGGAQSATNVSQPHNCHQV